MNALSMDITDSYSIFLYNFWFWLQDVDEADLMCQSQQSNTI